MSEFVWPEKDSDWRGTLIEPGCVVIYHAQTKGGKTIEAEVVSITEGSIYTGKTIMVRPLRESMIAVARPPGFYSREDTKLFAVPQLKVTVIKPAASKSFVAELVEGQMVRRNEKTLRDRDDPKCTHCGDPALYWGNTKCGPSGCYNVPA